MTEIKLLLVEDNEGDAFFIKELLSTSEKQFNIDWQNSLESGIEAIKTNSYDVIITDLNLSGNRGLDTFKMIIEISPLETPVLILTGLNDTELGLKAMSMGAQDYIVKNNLGVDLLTKSINYAIERKILENKLRALSNQDDVTDLLNRRGFEFLANQHYKVAKRKKRAFMIAFLDLDLLKEINDIHGHQEGSNAIINTSQILTNTFRSSDILARWGGDEFIVLATDTSEKSKDRILERLKKYTCELNRNSNLTYTISFSTGLSFYDPESPKTLEELIKEADQRMYENKNNKKKEKIEL